MEIVQKRPILLIAVAFLLGWAIGLFLFGWAIWPVEYVGAGPQDLTETHQERFLLALADSYALNQNQAFVTASLGQWPAADTAICQLASEQTDSVQQAKLFALAAAHNEGAGCPPGGTPPGNQDTGGGGGLGSILRIIGLGLLLLLLLVVIFFVWQSRTGGLEMPRGIGKAYNELEVVADAPMMESTDEDQQVTPIARFESRYTRGHDTYDDSFSIENQDGEFLGECGVGISESIGADLPKNVTAIEVWLFDKNDIRTVTKVIMSDHAFFDEAIKAKLAPKGEPVLARQGETVVLETASLIINAEITEMDYGTGTLPPDSFFENLTVELSAWAKDGDYGEPDVQGRIEEYQQQQEDELSF